MTGWAPWRNLWNLPGRWTISSPQVPYWWEHLAHQGFILGMDSRPLIEVAHMLHRIRSTSVNGEHWLMELPRRCYPFNLACEWRLGNLVQCFAHSVISQASTRRALVFMLVVVFFIIGKRLAGWSSWLSPITSIFFILRGSVRIGGGSFSPYMAQFSL